MDMPPTRYRVVERGRRLEVIDTVAPGAVCAEAAHASPEGQAGWWPRPVRFDGTLAWTTSSLYDAKAPRTITLDPGRAVLARIVPAALVALLTLALTLVAFAPWALTTLFVFANPKSRQHARDAITRMLDRLDT